MEKVILEANERKSVSKSSRSDLRKNGRVPGIYYSKHSNPIPVDVLERTINPLVFTSKTHLISLKLEGHEELDCIIRDIQFDPVTDRVMAIESTIINDDIECLPKDIPGHIEVDISALQIGDSIHVKDISLPDIEILNSEDSMIVMVSHQKVKEETTVSEEEVLETAEPEVIGKGKAEEDEEEKD